MEREARWRAWSPRQRGGAQSQSAVAERCRGAMMR
jgi:hypothetical protein